MLTYMNRKILQSINSTGTAAITSKSWTPQTKTHKDPDFDICSSQKPIIWMHITLNSNLRMQELTDIKTYKYTSYLKQILLYQNVC